MAAKNKFKNRKKDPKKVIFQAAEDDMEAEESGEEAEGDAEEFDDDGSDGEMEVKAKKGKGKKGAGEEELCIDDVLHLGGTQADFVMLAGLEDSSELVDGGKKGAIDDLEEGELQKFISKLGFKKFKDIQTIPDEEAKMEEEGEKEEGGNDGEKESKKAEKAKDKLVPEVKPSVSALKKPTESARQQMTTAEKDKKAPVQSAAAVGGRKAKLNANVFEFTQRQVLLVKPGGKWFDLDYTKEASTETQDPSLVSQYKALAQQLYEADVKLYKSKKNLQRGANSNWMKNVVSSGVLADRMAAMTVLIQDAPVHTLEHVEALVAMVKKKGSRRMGLMALDTLRELLLSDLLPEHRKLRPFSEHPFSELEAKASGNRDARDRRLLLWQFEHNLKLLVAEFVTALDSVAHDTVAATKAKALATAHEMLCNRPEQERALLIQVVNKLGDPEYKTAAKASHLLEILLHKHPNMKVVVCSEVERLMFRPNISPKAQYYSVCFLSQVMLSHEESALASKLITIYFSFFRSVMKKKDVESKMLSALLSGVNRAYPYAGTGDDKVKDQMDTLFKVVHLVKFNTAVQALMLLFQVMDSQQSLSDRYYVALYRKLLDPGLSSSSRQSMFLNLLYKSVKADIVVRRVKAFVKRLLQISKEQSAAFTCGALFLVSELIKARPSLKTMLQEEEGEDEQFKDLEEERESEGEEEKESEEEEEKESEEEEEERESEGEEEEEESDEEERFVDADKKLEEGTSEEKKEEKKEEKEKEKKPVASWVHHQNLEGGKTQSQQYDLLHRNPLFCGADHSTLWELHKLSVHYHPSVSLFAKTILQGDSIQYTGDPLQDFTLIRFLDRFVFRNPKHRQGKQNTDGGAALKPRHRQPLNSLPVNCEEFLSKEESQVPVEEIFFHRFFKKRAQEQQKKRPRRGEENDTESVQDVDDDEFEKILDDVEGDSYFTEKDLDFAGNVKAKKEKKKKGSGEEYSDSDSDLDGDDLDDEEVDLGSMSEEEEEESGDEMEAQGGTFMDAGDAGSDSDVPELDDDDEEAAAVFDDSEDEMEEEEEEMAPKTKKGKRKLSSELDFSGSLGTKQGKRQKKGKRDSAMFASAEEFGSMLDENAGSKFDNIGLNAMANRDKAGLKQLKWESNRDDWINNRDAKTMRRKKAVFNKNKKNKKSSSSSSSVVFGGPRAGSRMSGSRMKMKMKGRKKK